MDIPLVTRRDSALRPVGRALSEDCWFLADCISNQKCPPRVLFKNGKRDKLTVEKQPRSFTLYFYRAINNYCINTRSNYSAFMSGNLPQQPQLLSENHALGTSKSEISNRLVAREIATVREQLVSLQTEINQVKASISIDKNKNHVTSMASSLSSGTELLEIRNEIRFLHTKIDTLITSQQPHTNSHNLSRVSVSDNTRLSQITITSWNCRGLTTSLPYILHLINTGSDIISLSEHWLWPYNITTLSNIHPNYEGFGYCDQKLHESSTLTNGCGGVGFIWKKELNILPLYDTSVKKHFKKCEVM